MKKQIKFLSALCLIAFSGNAQIFHWESPIDSVSKDGYYRILLQPDVTSKLQTTFSDVRIYDQDSNETPYLIFKDDATYGVNRFVTYETVGKSFTAAGSSYLTVRNSLGNSIDHIEIEVDNTRIKDNMTLTGSNDGQHFFPLVDHFSVSSFDHYQKGSRTKINFLRFDFPFSDYKFFRFNFKNWDWWSNGFNNPAFIFRAGYSEPTFVQEECLEIPRTTLSQTDDAKTKESVIQINFPDSEYVDHLYFSISTHNKAGDFYRAANLYEMVEYPKDNGTITREQLIASTIFSSVSSNEIDLGKRRVKNLLLKISNDDNRPLIIDTVRAFQVKHYLVAFLEKKNKYCLRFGNDSLAAPVYDITHFQDKIPTTPDIINSGARKDISDKRISPSTKKKTEPTSTHFGDGLFKDKRIIWFTIGLVILLLGIMTTRMLKEMKSKEEK